MTTLSANAMVTVSPSRDLTVRAWPSSFSTVPRMRVGVPCGACWAPAGKISIAINAPASSNFVVIAVPPLVHLLSDVAILNTNLGQRASRRPHFLVTPFLGTVLPEKLSCCSPKLAGKSEGAPQSDGVCALALIKRTNLWCLTTGLSAKDTGIRAEVREN